MTESPKKSEKWEQARDTLPEELKPVFDNLVLHYKALALKHHKGAWVSYVVLADLVREVWRPTESPV